MIECLPSMHEALGSAPRITEGKSKQIVFVSFPVVFEGSTVRVGLSSKQSIRLCQVVPHHQVRDL